MKKLTERGGLTTAVIGVAAIATLLATGVIYVIHQDQTASASQSYSNNGLTCSFPPSTPSSMEYLVPKITEDSRFLNLTGGNPYIFEHGVNGTNNVLGMGTTTEYLPPDVELLFSTHGPNTTCGGTNELANALSLIVVDVPIEGGSFNISEASFHTAFAGE